MKKLRMFVAMLFVILFNVNLVNSANAETSVKQMTKAQKKRIVQQQFVKKTSKKYLGIPYIWGGSTPRGFDCSGFIRYVYAKINILLPHNARLQYGYGKSVSRNNLQIGDLVFFNNLGHVGMYIGNGVFIHSPNSSSYVKLSKLSERTNYYGAKRII